MRLLQVILTAALAALTAATPILADDYPIADTTTTTTTTTTTVGPENGHLVIVGGNLQSDSIWQRIIELAGGPSAPLVVIPTAGGDPTYDANFTSAATLRRLGAKDVTVLHTYDPEVADTAEFAAPLQEARGVYFSGGRQWRLVDAYAGTKTERALQAVLGRGGVVAGSSAGASIMGSFLARGDTANNQIMVGDHTVGFGYMKNTAIDQHVLVRNRQFDMFDILEVEPRLLGLAVDEDTALVVRGNLGEVVGSTYVVVYDGGFWSREGAELKTLPPPERRFYFLMPGDRYDLGKREVVRSARKRGEMEW